MKANFLKKGILVAAFAGAVMLSTEEVVAADNMSLTQAIKEVNTDINANALKSALVEVKKDTSVTATIAIKSTEEMQFELLFNGKAFANTEDAPIWHGIAGSFFLCVVSLAYAVYIIYKTKEEKE